jgi:DnaJ-domain-containing protein 1
MVKFSVKPAERLQSSEQEVESAKRKGDDADWLETTRIDKEEKQDKRKNTARYQMSINSSTRVPKTDVEPEWFYIAISSNLLH